MDIKQRRLPTDYQEVEWIQSSGAQYIDTGVSAPNGYKCIIDVSVGANATQILVGTQQIPEGGSGGIYRNMLFTNAGYFKLGCSASEYSGSAFTLNQKYAIEFSTKSNYYLKIDGTVIINGTNEAIRSSRNLLVFAGTTQWSPYFYANMKLYKNCKIYNYNDVLVRDFIPCYHKTSGIIGLYDIVGGQFYTNQGTGTFTKGDDVVTLESMTIPQGDVLRINDGNGNLLWKKHLYDFKDFWDEAVGYNLTTGEDENGKYVNTPGSAIYDKTFAYKSYAPNKKFRVFIRAVNTSYTGVTNLDLRYTDGTMSSVLTASLAGTTFETDSSKTFAGVHGRWHGGSPRIYDLYIDEVS